MDTIRNQVRDPLLGEIITSVLQLDSIKQEPIVDRAAPVSQYMWASALLSARFPYDDCIYGIDRSVSLFTSKGSFDVEIECRAGSVEEMDPKDEDACEDDSDAPQSAIEDGEETSHPQNLMEDDCQEEEVDFQDIPREDDDIDSRNNVIPLVYGRFPDFPQITTFYDDSLDFYPDFSEIDQLYHE